MNRGYGLANKDDNIPNTPDTVFDIGSVTKQFTATAILLLSDDGKLRMDDPLHRFFEDVPDDKKDITIHHLLTHTAGFVASLGGDFDHIARADYFETLFGTQLLFEPGQRHQYSNAGYSVLGRIIELASGQEYEEYLSEHLFKPAGMQHTGYVLPDWRNVTLAYGYMRNVVPRGSMVERYQNDGRVSWNLKGNGGINSTPNDMYRWHLALKSHRILSSALTAKLTNPYVPEREDGRSHYAYGWAVNTTNRGATIISHNGSNGVFFHEYLWLLEDDTVILFFTNAASNQVEVAWVIEKMLFDPLFDPDPIIKNVYQAVFDFIADHPVEDLSELKILLMERYSIEVGRPETLNRMGYLTLQSGENLQWAVGLFRLNTQLFEKDANAWDSLGDGYVAIGDVGRAARAYEVAVTLGSEGSKEKLSALLE